MASKKIGFIGLGDMGLPMARRLLQHGLTVFSCANRRREPIEVLKLAGLVERSDPRAVAAEVDVLLTIVLDEKQTDTVLRGMQGALQALKSGSILIVMSTLAPSYCQGLVPEASARGIAVLDCPVTGGNIGASEGPSDCWSEEMRPPWSSAAKYLLRLAQCTSAAAMAWARLPSWPITPSHSHHSRP